MKKTVFYVFIGLLMLSLSSCTSVKKIAFLEASPTSISQYDIQQDEYVSEFEDIHRTVSHNYAYYDTKGIDPQEMYREYLPLFEKVRYTSDFLYLLRRYFSDLKNSHSYPYLQSFGIAARARLVEGVLFIDELRDEEWLNQGVAERDIIIRIDGKSTEQWLKEEVEHSYGSTDAGRLNHAVRKVFGASQPGYRTYSVETGDGVKELSVHFGSYRRAVPSDVPYNGDIVVKVFDRSFGYMEIKRMMGPGDTLWKAYKSIVEEFKEEYMRVKNLDYLIVDVRKNGGGNSIAAAKIAEYLIREPQKPSASIGMLRPDKDFFKGEILLLIDTSTPSAGESFTLDLKESGNVLLIGSPTNGDTGGFPKRYRTSRGLDFVIPTGQGNRTSPQGFPMEGVGIPPHHFVEQTIEDYLDERDTVLEYALDYCRNHQLEKQD